MFFYFLMLVSIVIIFGSIWGLIVIKFVKDEFSKYLFLINITYFTLFLIIAIFYLYIVGRII